MADEQGGAQGKKEKDRLCPSCRMSISVLATKCRFCGENVGRPKDETRQLTIQDLGGETIVHYAPSHNVMEALEAFRAEESAAKAVEPPRKSLFGLRGKAAPGPSASGSTTGLPELDERSRALASVAMPIRSAARPAPSGPVWTKKLGMLGGFVALIVILYFGTVQGWAMIKHWSADKDTGPGVHNRAPEIMERGGPPIEALKAAMEALQQDNSTANLAIADQARQLVVAQVNQLLSKPDISDVDLQKASNLASQAFDIDVSRSRSLVELKSKADRDNRDYALTVLSTDTESRPPRARLQLNDGTVLDVRQGERVLDRFNVKLITADTVLLADTLYTNPYTGSFRAVRFGKVGIVNY